jgi:hypothetical protein
MTRKKLIAASGAILLVAATAGAWSIMSKRSRQPITVGQPIASNPSSQGKSAQPRPSIRNLSLQPEALAMSRRLGSRFASDKREKSVLVGTLTISGDRRTVQTIRTQTDDGETIEIKVSGSGASLTWDSNHGCQSGGNRASDSDRELIERLVFDSPDQFVLAQLRGASYLTIARNVRPANAGEKYTGPLWNIIRTDDPTTDESKAPQSRWRLYYVNAVTGAIERIESEIAGNRIVAEFSGWAQQNGETFPTQITWKQKDQILMQYILNNFSHSDKEQQ